MLALFISLELKGQSFPQWGKLNKGRYDVGYFDTVIVKHDENFSYHSYQGCKPFIVGIWYPSKRSSKSSYMLFKDYFNFKAGNEHAALLDSLKKAYHKVLVDYGILVDITPQDSIVQVPFGSIQKGLYEDVLNTRVGASYRLLKPKKKSPSIIYHHGAQSALFDNNVFCEYMASHGYVVISSNFNLPDETGRDLLIPATNNRFSYLTYFQFVVEFAKKLAFVDSTRMTAIGHSLGAQVELMHDNLTLMKSFKKIIALHTTLESRTVEDALKIWPKFTYLFDNQAKLSTTTSFIFAPTNLMYRSGKDSVTKKEVILQVTKTYPKFLPFRNNKITPYTFVTVDEPIKHDGFISLGNFRFPLLSKYHLRDQETIIKQQQTFERIVELTKDIISISDKNFPTFESKMYSGHFHFESVN